MTFFDLNPSLYKKLFEIIVKIQVKVQKKFVALFLYRMQSRKDIFKKHFVPGV